MNSMNLKQPAMTKHPVGTASFYIRVRLPSGGSWQICTEKPRPIAEIIESLERDYIPALRLSMAKGGTSPAIVKPVDAQPEIGSAPDRRT